MIHTTTRAAVCAALAAALALILAACASPQAGGSAATTASITPGGDCKTMQGQLADLKATGQGHSKAYNDLLNRYLKRCFDH